MEIKKTSIPISTFIYAIGLIFAAGVAHSELKHQSDKINVLEQILEVFHITLIIRYILLFVYCVASA